jgi:type II secretory pathway predicted ATPase ExeA
MHFGLSCKPFENTPDPSFLFLSEQHREVLAALDYGIDSAKGFVLVAGDVGTGKTTLIHALLKKLDPAYLVLHIINPRLIFNDLINILLKRLGIESQGKDNFEIVEAIQQKLESLDHNKNRVVLIIDEAHLLSPESYEAIRLLSNIESEKRKLIQIILAGQIEIYNKLQEDSLKPLQQRLVINRTLEELDKKETQDYISHRLRVAGRESRLFDKKATLLIWKRSRGIPRLINQICDNALLIGYAMKADTIGAGIIKEVINDMDSGYAAPAESFFPPLQKIKWVFIGLAAALLIGYISAKLAVSNIPAHENLKEKKNIALYKPGSAPEPDESAPENSLLPYYEVNNQESKTQEALPETRFEQNSSAADKQKEAKKRIKPEIYAPAGVYFITISSDQKKGTFREGVNGHSSRILKEFYYKGGLNDGLYVLGKNRRAEGFIFDYQAFLKGCPYSIPSDLWDELPGYISQHMLLVCVGPSASEISASGEDVLEISRSVGLWAEAWSSMNITKLMSCYADVITTFYTNMKKPIVYSLDELCKQKNAVFKKNRSISLQISEPLCALNPVSPQTGIAIFYQEYKSSVYHDKGVKILYFGRADRPDGKNSWNIFARLWLPLSEEP